jgi:hypothetical protein
MESQGNYIHKNIRIFLKGFRSDVSNGSRMWKLSDSDPVELEQDPDIFPATGLSLVIRGLADRVNWLAVVDGLLPWDAQRAKIAPSVVLLTLIMNVLTQRNPLYRVEDWVATLPLPILWGDAVTAAQVNDDALGRVLEDLADHGRALLATLGARMQAVEQVQPRVLHADTTAFALFGDYPDPAHVRPYEGPPSGSPANHDGPDGGRSRSGRRRHHAQRQYVGSTRPLWVLLKEDGSAVWYHWGRVPAHARRILEALQIPVTRRLVWDPSG